MMKFELEPPYNNDWTNGYLYTNSENRKMVQLYNKNTQQRSGTSYARYLLSVKHGRYLTENEEADHINTDKTNDSIENLQILTIEEHKEKSSNERNGITYVSFVCETCKNEVVREKRNIGSGRFCSPECVTNSPAMSNNPDWRNEIEDLLNQGLSDYKIAKELGINRNTVIKYRNDNNIPVASNRSTLR